MPIAFHLHDPRTSAGCAALARLQRDGLLIVNVSAMPDPSLGTRIALARVPAHLTDVWTLTEGTVEADRLRIEVDAFPERDDYLVVSASVYHTIRLPGQAPRELRLVWPLGTPAGCLALFQIAAAGRLAIARKADAETLAKRNHFQVSEGTPMLTLEFNAAIGSDLLDAALMGQEVLRSLDGADGADGEEVVAPPAPALDDLLKRIGAVASLN